MKSINFYMYLSLALILLLSCWMGNDTKAKAAGTAVTIPKQAIRLRILANSDTFADQNVKKKVRDAVVEQIDMWVQRPEGMTSARAAIRSNIPQISAITRRVLQENGFHYGYRVKLGVVPFPTKMYGNQVYPAGNYEALRITLGSGRGQNWWCVLFPPLCFVNAASGDAVAVPAIPVPTSQTAAGSGSSNMTSSAAAKRTSTVQSAAGSGHVKLAAASSDHTISVKVTPLSQEKVHFFLWDLLKNVFSWIHSLFSRH